MTIIEEIPKYGLTRSPLFYYVSDVNYANDGFYYYADVYVWQGLLASKPGTPTIRLSRYPDANGAAAFDVGNVLNAQLDAITAREDGAYYESGVAWVSVEFGYYDDDTGDHDAEETGTTQVGIKGYSEYLDGINYNASLISYGGSPTNRWLTTRGDDSSGFTVTVYTGKWFTLALPYDTAYPLDTVKLWDDNSNTVTYDLATAIPTITDSKQKVLIFPCGYNSQIVDPANFAQLKNFIAELNPISEYYIRGFTSGGTTPATSLITLEIGDCAYFELYNLQFINRWGVWENLVLTGRKRNRLMVERNETFRTPVTYAAGGVTIDTALGQYQSQARAREEFTVTTGWLNETENELIKQMLVSPRVINGDDYTPLIISTNNWDEKTVAGEQLISYDLNFKHAHEFINTVR